VTVERALFLAQPDSTPLEGYQRIYFGAEFCSWAFPSLAEINAALSLAREATLPFTLVTPVLREETLTELSDLFSDLSSQLQPQDEVVISDFGALALTQQHLPQVDIVIGRALSGQKRGPRIEQLELTADARDYFQQGSWYNDDAVALLLEQGIARVELDNLLQGLAPLPKPLRGSLHTPYAMVTSSRNCPFHRDKNGQRCAQRCGEVFRLSTEQTPYPLLQAGNCQFLEISSLPENPAALGIDRLVEHQCLPR
jgi:hypothetical protein